MSRHVLMIGVVAAGLLLIGSNVAKRRLEIELDTQIQHEMAESLSVSQNVDAQFERVWRERGLQPAQPANNLLVARRLALSLTGTVPSLQEIRALESVAEDQQIEWWLQHLFQDQRYGDYLGERFARAFVGTEDGPFLIFRRRRFVSWLSDWIMANKPYDEMVRSLISDHGNWTGKPAVNFVTVTTGSTEKEQPDPERLAARTTRAFLGIRLDCMQCHDDNLGGDWLQSDFHQLAAYYSEARSFGLGLGIRDASHEYEYRYLHAEEDEVVEPQVPFAKELLEQSAKSRRQQLAEWVTHRDNKAFSRAAVNRVWALMFGRPLVDPVDDIPLEGPYPPGLELLAEDFSQHHDMRRLISQIAMTRVFQQDSRLPNGVTTDDEINWSVFPLVRLRPEQMAGSIVQTASLATLDSNSHILLQLARFDQMENFVKRYGDLGEDEFSERGGTIPQRLIMLNGNLVRERTKDDLVANAATRVAQQVRDDERAVEVAFLITLTRRPTEIEQRHFVELMRNTNLSRARRLEDVFWALLNSTEFSWNH